MTVYIGAVTDTVRYAIGNLADLGGVSRRTVRYYVQEGLLPAPLGLGRGNHYGRAHLEQLLRVKALQEAGLSLDEIKATVVPGEAVAILAAAAPRSVVSGAVSRAVSSADPLPRELWRRVTLAPGVELHVSNDVRLPPPGKLSDLAAWCRTHFHANPTTTNEDPDA